MTLSASIRSRGYLPHWERAFAVYFVTFRLADSLPQKLIAEIRTERELLRRIFVAQASRRRSSPLPPDRTRLRKLNALLRKAETCLDKGLGHCYMRQPDVAAIVARSIQHFDADRYQLFAWCVMPNHVHVRFLPLPGFNLASILQSWKSYSAHCANAALGRSGVFWQREYFDHLARSESHLLKFAKYIEQNPEKAGLKNWPWVSSFCTAGVPPASASPTFGSPGHAPASASSLFCSAGVSPANLPKTASQKSPTRRPEPGATKENQ